ncbi:MAG: NUDIX hydrolase [Candidatus Dojkabacteria bacterium]
MQESKFYRTNILPSLPIHQIYIWFVTSDNKMVLVKTKSGSYQLPGGKPLLNETKEDTLSRELFEESGIKIENMKPQLFGYYLVKNDPYWPEPEYLQLRYFFKSNRNSTDFTLETNEPDDNDKIVKAEFINASQIFDYITWMKVEPDEYNAFSSMI